MLSFLMRIYKKKIEKESKKSVIDNLSETKANIIIQFKIVENHRLFFMYLFVTFQLENVIIYKPEK